MVAGGLNSHCYHAETGFLYFFQFAQVNLIGNKKKLPKVRACACVCALGEVFVFI